MSTHIYAAIDQALVDVIFDDAVYPVTIFEKSFQLSAEEMNSMVSAEDMEKTYRWASKKAASDPIAAELLEKLDALQSSAADVLRDDLDYMFVKVELVEDPLISLAVPETFFANARFELSVKILIFPPLKEEIRASGSLNWSIDGLSVRFHLHFDRLRFRPPWDWLKVEDAVNRFLSAQPFAVLDASKFVAPIPIVNTQYRVKALSLPSGNELRLDVEFEKV